MGVLQKTYENARHATDYARRRTFEAQARLEAARLEVATLEAFLAGAERDLATAVAAEADARRRWVARAGARRQGRPAAAVGTPITSLGTTVRTGEAAVTMRAAHVSARA